MLHLIWHWATLAIGLFILSRLPFFGVSVDHPTAFLWAAGILIVLNTFIRPILIFISLPLVLLSLGLFLLVINGIVFYCLPQFVSGFHVASFHGAFFGSILLSVITWFFGGLGREKQRLHRMRQGELRGPGEVIDV